VSGAGDTWREVERVDARLRADLDAHGLAVRAPLRRGEGVLSGWRAGVVYVAPTSLDSPADALRATMHGAMMGLTPEAAAGLFRLMIPRVLGHELGHALRAERGLMGADPLAEEQEAERLGAILFRRHGTPAARAEAQATFRVMSERLGDVAVSVGLHRHAELASAQLGLRASPDAVRAAAASFRRDYYSDFAGYLRRFAAWLWVDLSLDADGDLDDFAARLSATTGAAAPTRSG
jgi:hypothetical protein